MTPAERDSLADLASRFDAPGVARDTRAATQQVARKVRDSARAKVPVRTGNLRRSITFNELVRKTGVAFEVGTNLIYGIFVERGTSTMAPRPYLGPAIAEQLPAWHKRMEELAQPWRR